MNRILKIELKRAFCNRLFLISLLIGCVIATAQFVFVVCDCIQYVKIVPGHYMLSVFNQSICFMPSFWTNLFFMIFPILAALPFADSFFTDRKSGYIKNIFTRTNKNHYYISKYIAVFLSGGLVVIIPLILNLYLTALVIPSVIPDVASQGFSLSGCGAIGASVFYTHPYIYFFVYTALIFVTAGLLATIALAFSNIIKFKYIIVLTPFLIFLLSSFASDFFNNYGLDIANWISPGNGITTNFLIVLCELIIIFVFVILFYFIKGGNDEVY